MKVAIISDTHDNIWVLDQIAEKVAKCEVMIHCGDLCSPFMVSRISTLMAGKPIHMVWGNNDGDKRLITILAEKAGNFTIHGDFASLNLDNIKIAINHYPDIGRALAASNQYQLVCYGHDHKAHDEWVGDTLLLNPGELMGLYGSRAYVIYDTQMHSFERIQLD